MQDSKSITDLKIYPVIFIICLSVVFTGMLAFFYHSTKDRVRQYNEERFQQTILELFEIINEEVSVSDLFANHITVITRKNNQDEMKFYQAKKDNVVLGYAFVIYGKGLWGSIEASIAFDAELNEILGFRIFSQNETPGLGARITENWFLNQFRQIPVFINGQMQRLSLIDENEVPQNVYEIRRVTGATSSTAAVVKMIMEESEKIKNTIRIEE